MVFDLVFASSTILSCFFFFFLIIDSYLLISEVITEISIAAIELGISTGTPNNETKSEIEAHPVTVEAKISKCSA